jgi:hypothetical protein
MTGRIYQATRSFSAAGRTVNKGETVREGHRLLLSYPDKFELLCVTYDTVEQATAAPGEKRTQAQVRAKV